MTEIRIRWTFVDVICKMMVISGGQCREWSMVRPLLNALLLKRGFTRKIGVVGAPFAKGQKEVGVKEKGLEAAPDAIRKHVLHRLKLLDVDVVDYGDVRYQPLMDPPPAAATKNNMVNYNHVVPILQQVSEMVGKVLRDGRICLTLGGDHSLAAATISAHATVAGPEAVAVIYIDAHADMNLSDTSPSGNMHGMPVAIAAQEFSQHWNQFPGLAKLSSRVPLKNVGLVGVRSVDPGEARLLQQHSVAAFSASDVTRMGIAETLRQVLTRVDAANNKRLHVSIDIDALDPLEAPSTTVPVRGGLSLREVVYVAETLSATGRVAAVDLVEVNPLIGSEEDRMKTLDAARHILLACFGHTTLLK